MAAARKNGGIITSKEEENSILGCANSLSPTIQLKFGSEIQEVEREIIIQNKGPINY